MEVWNLSQEDIDAAHERAKSLQLLDEPLDAKSWAPSHTATEWREAQRRAAWWDCLIMWASIVGIVGIVVLLATGMMR
jgi:hypothetical protein